MATAILLSLLLSAGPVPSTGEPARSSSGGTAPAKPRPAEAPRPPIQTAPPTLPPPAPLPRQAAPSIDFLAPNSDEARYGVTPAEREAFARIRARLREAFGATALRPLEAPLARCLGEAVPTVDALKTKLSAVRELEAAARTVLATSDGPARLEAQRLVALGWLALAELASTLAERGEGETAAVREAVKELATREAAQGYALARAGLRPVQEAAPGVLLAEARAPELQACWQLHLLARQQAAPLAVVVEVGIDPKGFARDVAFEPPLDPGQQLLGQCLTTRLLGWQFTEASEAEAVQLPLRFQPVR